MTEKQEIRLAGFGGQGIILSGHILGKAAALFEEKNAVFTQSYGPEARGGSCSADVVISDETIHYPKVEQPDRTGPDESGSLGNLRWFYPSRWDADLR